MVNWDRRVKKVRRSLEDVADDAGDAYDHFRGHVRDRAGQVWDDRQEYLDDAVSFAEDLGDAAYRRLRADPLGTIAIGFVLVWLIGRTVRR